MKNTRVIGVVIASILFGLASVAPAMAIVTVPSGLNPGDQYRLAFVTSTTHNALSSDIDVYNAFVTGVANSQAALAALSTTWKAIGSTASMDARDNTGTNPSATGVPIYLLNDKLIANNNADLWDGSIDNPLNIDEQGGILPALTWTGTISDGMAAGGQALGGLGASVAAGDSNQADSRWAWTFSVSQENPRPYYALSGDLTAPVPIPAAFYLFGTAIAALLGVGWRRRSAST